MRVFFIALISIFVRRFPPPPPPPPHALHCKNKNHCIQRHNSLRNILKKYFEKAGYECHIEEKMHEDSNVKGIPGDLMVSNWDSQNENTYFDLAVVNVNAKSYVKIAAKERLGAAKLKEKYKITKYNNHSNFIPLILETHGGIGPRFRKILQHLSDKISKRTNEDYGVIINRIRASIIADMMHSNSIMIEAAAEM